MALALIKTDVIIIIVIITMKKKREAVEKTCGNCRDNHRILCMFKEAVANGKTVWFYYHIKDGRTNFPEIDFIKVVRCAYWKLSSKIKKGKQCG